MSTERPKPFDVGRDDPTLIGLSIISAQLDHIINLLSTDGERDRKLRAVLPDHDPQTGQEVPAPGLREAVAAFIRDAAFTPPETYFRVVPRDLFDALRAALDAEKDEPVEHDEDYMSMKGRIQRLIDGAKDWHQKYDEQKARAEKAEQERDDNLRTAEALHANLAQQIKDLRSQLEGTSRNLHTEIDSQIKFRVEAEKKAIATEKDRDALSSRLKAVREELMKKWDFLPAEDGWISRAAMHRKDCPALAALLAGKE